MITVIKCFHILGLCCLSLPLMTPSCMRLCLPGLRNLQVSSLEGSVQAGRLAGLRRKKRKRSLNRLGQHWGSDLSVILYTIMYMYLRLRMTSLNSHLASIPTINPKRKKESEIKDSQIYKHKVDQYKTNSK